MKIKKIMIGILCTTMLLASSLIFADGTKQEVDNFLIGSFTGTVKEINDREDDSQFISLETKDDLPITMIVSKDTYIVENKEIIVGDTVTGYYNANAPMIMIYPPQYNPFAVVVESDNQQVKIDIFNKDLVSSDQMLKLNISEDTQIVQRDGTKFAGNIEDKKLAVIYTFSTKSIPAQTTPSKVIVLSDISKEEEFHQKDLGEMDIIVSNKRINASKAYGNHKGIVMVPLRAIAESLGFQVVWEDKDHPIMVGEDVSITIGVIPNNLEAAAEFSGATSYVPLNFFKKVLGMNNAYVFEGQIVIDNEEEMH